jgi:hypothetical protein
MNIYEQQYQMHRFAVEFFPQNVAVNDIGWVSYRNGRYVLDLWGLGSEEARQGARSNGRTTAFLRDITERNAVVYAMIYDSLFPGSTPPEWCRIAELETSQVSAASGTVTFYLIDPSKEAEMARALQRFSSSLPTGARLQPHATHRMAGYSGRRAST